MCLFAAWVSRRSNRKVFLGENVPEEEQLSSREQKSIEPYDNTPIIDNLLPAGGGVTVSEGERSKYEEDISNLYKQLDNKVGMRNTLLSILCFRVELN